MTDHDEAVALAYWTDQPVRLTGCVPLLKISMKSFLKGAFAFPPPPNSCEITSFGEGAGVGDGVGEGIGVAVGEGVGEGIGVAVGVGLGEGIGEGEGESVGVGVGVGVGIGVTRMNTEPSCRVPGLKGWSDELECKLKPPVMSGERVRDWLRSPRRPRFAP